jgi:hypothetical protein
MKKLKKEDMVDGPSEPNNPDTFKKKITDELSKRFNAKKISNSIYTVALQISSKGVDPLKRIYKGEKDGLNRAVDKVIEMSKRFIEKEQVKDFLK